MKRQFAPLSCVFGNLIIPQRYVTMLMLHLGVMNFFQLRNMMEVVLSGMALPQNYSKDSCPELTYKDMEHSHIKGTLPAWIMNGGYYISYTISQLPGGYVADRWGAKHVLGTSMLICAISTLILPTAIYDENYAGVTFLRTARGIFQGPLFPSLASLVQHWTTYTARPFAGSMFLGGNSLGLITSTALTEYIIGHTGDWALTFYIWGSLGLLWYLFYLCTVFSSPVSHPFILEDELEYFESNIEMNKEFSVPWVPILVSKPVWALFFINFCETYTTYHMTNLVPKYIFYVLKWDISNDPMFNVMPFLAYWLTNTLTGFLAYYLITNNISTLLSIRKTYGTIVNVGPALCSVVAIYLECNREATAALYIMGWCMKGLLFNGILLNVNDLTKHYPGTVMGVANGLSATAAVLANWITSKVTELDSSKEGESLAWIMFGFCVIASAVFLTFGQAERQPWDFPSDSDIDSI